MKKFDGDDRGKTTGILLGRFVYWLLRERWDEKNQVLQEMIEHEFPNRRTVQRVTAYRSYCRNEPHRMGKGLSPIHGKLNSSQNKEFAEFKRLSSQAKDRKKTVTDVVVVGETSQVVSVRSGQSDFSKAVRKNFGQRCCFPECDVDEDALLIGAHIERWADAPSGRGKVANGLCLCALHDRAFEVGLFVLTDDFQVHVTTRNSGNRTWLKKHLLPHSGVRIRLGSVKPSKASIRRHRKRHTGSS